MALWGKSTTDESKPKYLDRVNKNGLLEDCFADERGWVLRHYKQQGDKAAAVTAGEYWDEVLVAIGGLGGSGATDLLADANITAVFFEQEALAQGDTGTVVVIYNELVTVGGTPGELAITVNTTDTAGTFAANYVRGSGTNRLEFDFTVPSATATLSIVAGNLTLGAATLDTPDLAFTNIVGAGGSGTDFTIDVA